MTNMLELFNRKYGNRKIENKYLTLKEKREIAYGHYDLCFVPLLDYDYCYCQKWSFEKCNHYSTNSDRLCIYSNLGKQLTKWRDYIRYTD